MTMQRFKGKTVFITGGTNGMGFATARRFINEGASVIITAGAAKQSARRWKSWALRPKDSYPIAAAWPTCSSSL